MVSTLAPSVLTSLDSPLHARQLAPRELHNHHHGFFLFGRTTGAHRGAPQFVIACLACRQRHCVRTASSMFSSLDVTCGCGRLLLPEQREYRFRFTRFGELWVAGARRDGQQWVCECVCLCGRRGLTAHRVGPRLHVTERALRDGSIWACLDCMRRRAADAGAAAGRAA